MARRVDNAFTRSWSAQGSNGKHPSTVGDAMGSAIHGADAGGSQAGPQGETFSSDSQAIANRATYAPMRASLVRLATEQESNSIIAPPACRWSVQVSPMRLADALDVWRGIGDRACTLVMNAQVLVNVQTLPPAKEGGMGRQPSLERGHLHIPLHGEPEDQPRQESLGLGGRLAGISLAALCEEVLGSDSDPMGGLSWQRINPDCVLIADEALARLAGEGRLVGATLVRMDGTIEPADALAVRAAVLAGRPAWEGDFRAVAVLEASDDRAIALVTSEEDLALMLIAENLRQYVSAILDHEYDGIGWVLPAQVHRLLENSGSLVVRPIETDVYSTFVDVGVCTSSDEDSPAGEGLIYDLPTRSWHTE